MADKCVWMELDLCKHCNCTPEEFVNSCEKVEMFSEMACACINCNKGIMNPTYDGFMACDKCDTKVHIKSLAKLESHKFLKEYI